MTVTRPGRPTCDSSSLNTKTNWEMVCCNDVYAWVCVQAVYLRVRSRVCGVCVSVVVRMCVLHLCVLVTRPCVLVGMYVCRSAVL